MSAVRPDIDEVLAFTRELRADRQWRARALRLYWSLAFRLTRFIEAHVDQAGRLNPAMRILNFGCGNRHMDHAINSDLFAPHRLVGGRRRPDLYWSGTAALPGLAGRFAGIVCEHVIEHMLPDDALALFGNFRQALEPGGALVVSFPDVAKVLAGGRCQGYGSLAASVNAVIYRHGHTFMYDAQTVAELLAQAGFARVEIADFDALPLREHLGAGRAPESSYVVAHAQVG